MTCAEVIPDVIAFNKVVPLVALELSKLAVSRIVAVIPAIVATTRNMASRDGFATASLPTLKSSAAFVVVITIALAGRAGTSFGATTRGYERLPTSHHHGDVVVGPAVGDATSLLLSSEGGAVVVVEEHLADGLLIRPTFLSAPVRSDHS